MKVYKLKHKPTGLYFQPSRGSGNLSRKGKVYTTPPKIEWGSTLRIKWVSYKPEPTGHHKTITDFFNIDWNKGIVDKYVKTNPNDWEIEEFE